MAKKAGKKKRKHSTVRRIYIKQPAMESQETIVNKIMLENFVSLQKVLTNLSIKLDGLTTQISKLLELFEISAKALAEKDFEVERDNKAMLEKIDSLLDQNKILARGLSLVHERIPREQYTPQPLPQMPSQQAMQSAPQYTPPPTSPYIREIPSPIQGMTPSQFTPQKRPFSQESSNSEEPSSFESPI